MGEAYRDPAGVDPLEGHYQEEGKFGEYYGIYEKAPEFYGLSQYREPFNYELAGQFLRLVLDDDVIATVRFLDGHTLIWKDGGAPAEELYYECLKGGEKIYLVYFNLPGREPARNVSLILDLEERLVSVVHCITEFDAQYPLIVDTGILFGYIALPGYEIPEKRHAYTEDLIGKRIMWRYSPVFELTHVYADPRYVRVGISRDIPQPPEAIAAMSRNPYEEEAHYIKLREGFYLLQFLEKNMSRRGISGNSLLFVMDMKRVHDVGRIFGHAPNKGEGLPELENYGVSAVGRFMPSDGVIEARVSPYTYD